MARGNNTPPLDPPKRAGEEIRPAPAFDRQLDIPSFCLPRQPGTASVTFPLLGLVAVAERQLTVDDGDDEKTRAI